MKTIKIKIAKKNYEFKLSFRTLMVYEELSGKGYTTISSLQDILVLMYSALLCCNKDIDMEWDKFLYIMDNDPNLLGQFMELLKSDNTPTEGK